MNTPLIIHLAGSAGEGIPLPLGLSGMPTEIEGRPVFYRRKEICRVVKEQHRGMKDARGNPLIVDIPTSRLDLWSGTFKRRLGKGIKPFIYPRHLAVDQGEPADARQTQGYLIDVDRQGDKYFGTLQLIGQQALDCAAANDVSVTVTGDALDSEFIHHVAFTPMPQITGMGGYTALVASADGQTSQMPIFVLDALSTSGSPPERSPIMKPETITKLRAKLSLADTVSDADVAEKAAAIALLDPPADLAPQVTALSADVTRLTTELATATAAKESATLALSAAQPKEFDALSLSLISESFKSKREAAIASGNISEAGMNQLDALLIPGGKPSGVALALSGDGIAARPLYSRVCEIIAANPGVKLGNGVERQAAMSILSLDGSEKPMTPERMRYVAECLGVPVPAAKSA